MRRVVLMVLLAACGREHFDIDASLDASTDARPDARACVAPADCPSARVLEFQGSCYVRCLSAGTRPAAAFACAQWGGCLASISNQVENDAVASLIPPAGTSWLGLEQAPNAATPNDGWTWCDGTTLGFSKWMPTKPDGGELCVKEDLGGIWDDAPCGNMYDAFVCERPL